MYCTCLFFCAPLVTCKQTGHVFCPLAKHFLLYLSPPFTYMQIPTITLSGIHWNIPRKIPWYMMFFVYTHKSFNEFLYIQKNQFMFIWIIVHWQLSGIFRRLTNKDSKTLTFTYSEGGHSNISKYVRMVLWVFQCLREKFGSTVTFQSRIVLMQCTCTCQTAGRFNFQGFYAPAFLCTEGDVNWTH